jgi:glycosyltransferase involved in cell wall biosynthesis
VWVFAGLYSAARVYSSGIRQPLRNFYGDFLAGFPSSRVAALVGRLDLYHGSLAEEWAHKFGGARVWHYGPVMHLVTLPLFAFASLRSAYLAWLIATYVFLLITLVLLWRIFDLGPARWIALLAIANFVPLYEALVQRTIEVFELMLVVAAFLFMQSRRQRAAGIAIGLAAMTKFLPLIFIPYFALKRMWRALAASVVTVAVIALATEIMLGWRNSGILIQLQEGSFLVSELNQSLSGMIIRALTWTHASLPVPLVSRLAIVSALAGLSWLMWRTRRRSDMADVEWGTLLLAMVLLPPHNEQYYFVFLIFPFLALLARRVDPWRLALAYVLVGAPWPFGLLGEGAFNRYLQVGIPFFGAAILAGLCVRVLWRAGDASPSRVATDLGALYVCYFGLREPLVQTQVLPYLRELARGGVRMSLVTFEPELETRWNEASIADWKDRLRRDGIDWHLLRYHRRPTLPATLYDIVRGAWRVAMLARRERLDVLHGRSHVGTAIAMLARPFCGARAIFDIRGLLAEEYVESGHWKPDSYLVRLVAAAERWLCRSADGFVVLTERVRDRLFPTPPPRGQPVAVIPCCVDLDRFGRVTAGDRDVLRRALGISDRVVFVHAGSLGGAYAPGETVAFLAAARDADPRAFLLVLSHEVSQPLVEALERAGFSTNDYRILAVAPHEVPGYLNAADAGLAIVHPGPARDATSPTKVAEYLAAGRPVVATAIGDLDRFIERARIGTILRGFDRAALGTAVEAINALWRDPELAGRCRREAETRFDLATIGGPSYRRLYDAVARGRPCRVLALASYPLEAASSRFRIVQFMQPLSARRIEVDFSPFLDRRLFAALYTPTKLMSQLPRLALAMVRRCGSVLRAIRADVVVVQREAMLFGPPVVEWMAVRVLGRPLVLDLDDPTYITSDGIVYGRLGRILKWPGKTDRLIRWSRIVVCGNPNIAEYVRTLQRPAEVVPTVVDTGVYQPACADREVPVIGWIGTHTTYPYLERLLPVFERLARSRRFTLTVVGSGRTDLTVRGLRVDGRTWRLDREVEDFQSIDIGVYPLDDDAWSAAKSGLKAVQYMACGVPFVMSPVGVCAHMGVAGETHFAATTDEEWETALARLLDDRALGAAIGRAGRAFAEQHYSIDQQADRLAAIIGQVSRSLL